MITVPKAPQIPTIHNSFLLRVRRERDGSWRIMLQHVRTRVSYGFENLAEAFAFIESICIEGEMR
jgi:hypothetical protein